VEIVPLPKSPEIVLGAINFKGEIIPVINVRKRFRLPERELELSDQLLIAGTARRKLALLVDAVVGVMDCGGVKVIEADAIVPGLEYVEGVVKLDDGLILIHNLATFLSLDEENALTKAMT
jgi:purine-binding chemotaxis protein CheW